MVESKFYKKKNSVHQKIQSKISKYVTKILITIIITLLLLIGFKWNHNFKKQFNQYVYHTSFPFAKVKEFYQKYFGEDIVSKTVEKENSVFSETLTFQEQNLYHDGVKLSVTENYMIPSLESGIVVYMGEKENYGNTIIVQGMNGVDVWYGNVENENVKLYDYVEKGTLIGEAGNTTLYLAFQKEGNFVNYKDYLSQN